MAIRGDSLTVTYTALNTTTNQGQPGDAANHILRIRTDSVSSFPTNAPVEVDPVNDPGDYSIVLTAAEMGGDFIRLTGTSSTPNVRIIPVPITTERGLMPLNTDWTPARAQKLDYLDAYVSSRMPASATSGGGGGGPGGFGSVSGVFLPSQVYLGIQDRISVEATALRLDDVPPHEFGDVFLEASAEVDFYLWQRYSPNALAGNNWVYQRLVDVAAYMLCERRNEAPGPGITGKFNRTLKMLEKIQLGRGTVPNAAQRKADVPILSNTRTRSDPYPRPVVERFLSTGKADGYTQNVDTTETPGDYSI